MSDASRPIHESEVEKNLAERDFYAAQARKEAALAEKEATDAQIKRINLAKALRDEATELAKNIHHKVYVFDAAVGEASVKMCINQLVSWSRQYPACEIEIQLNSPGGSIFDGFALIDFLRSMQERDHKITITVLGMAASMAGVILQAADTRVMGANALMLIHEGSLGASGDFGHVEDRMKLMRLMHERILTLFEERARPINTKVTKRFIRSRWERKDWWLTGEDCLKLGFVDEVR